MGRGIPDHISSLPSTVLQTPFGQMLKPYLDQSLRGVTQAPVPPAAQPNGALTAQPNGASSAASASASGTVHDATTLAELHSLIDPARVPCAVLFFTSASCPPCRVIAPTVTALAAELGARARFVRIDLSRAAPDLRAAYPDVRATPTFVTSVRGEKVEQWSGADAGRLEANARLLVQMAQPSPRYAGLDLPTLRRRHDARPTLFAGVPPLEKLKAKLDARADEEPVATLLAFVTARTAAATAADVPLPPALPSVVPFLQTVLQSAPQPPDALFPLVDLLRLALLDPRVSALVLAPSPPDTATATATTGPPTLPTALLAHLARLLSAATCPYPLHITALQALANLFSAPPSSAQHLVAAPATTEPLASVLAASLLSADAEAGVGAPRSYAPVRAAAAALALNALTVAHARRLDGKDDGDAGEAWRAEVGAALVEALRRAREDKAEAKGHVKGLVLALGLAVYGSEEDGEVQGVMDAVGAWEVLAELRGHVGGGGEVAGEVLKILGGG